MHLLVCYDVNTETPQGRKRLRKVAEKCESFGQRVQKSLFECLLNEMQYEALKYALLDIIDEKTDSLLFYRLPGGREACLESFGKDDYEDFTQPLLI